MSISQIPSGWTITRSDERIVVQHVSGSFYAAAAEGDSGIAESILYMLADSLLSATLSPAHIEDGEEVEVVGHLALDEPFNGAEGLEIGEWEFVPERSAVESMLAVSTGEMVPLMTVAQHQRIVAARASKAAARAEDAAAWLVVAKYPHKGTRRAVFLYEQNADDQAAEWCCDDGVVTITPLTSAALSAPPAAATSIQLDVRRCQKCGHVGVNDSLDGHAACHNCDWNGLEPDIDHCPGCQDNNCMGASCPECHGLYELLADTAIDAPPAAGVPEGWRELAQQAADALQVFTGHDSGPNLRHRYGKNWWEPLDQLRDKLRAMLKAPTPPAPEQQRAVVMPEGLREALGKAASSWLYENDPQGLDWCDPRNVDALLDALFEAAPHLAKGEGV